MTKNSSVINLLAGACFLLISVSGSGGQKAAADAGGSPYRCALKPSAHGRTIERRYSMTARVRPLLFWISRSGVGDGRISWIESADGSQGLELLIGSDPARTPRQINRWGYAAERVSGSSAELLAVMTESEEHSYDQAAARQNQTGGIHAFKAIRGRMEQGQAESRVIRLYLQEDFTYREADALLCRIPRGGPATRQLSVPAGAEPGFLFAVRRMLHQNVEDYRRSGKVRSDAQSPRTYVYNATLYELVLKSSKFLKTALLDGCEYRSVIESCFETRNTRTAEISKFSITYGTEDPNKEIPISIVYQPRWWFQAELRLEGELLATAEAVKD